MFRYYDQRNMQINAQVQVIFNLNLPLGTISLIQINFIHKYERHKSNFEFSKFLLLK